MIVFLYYSEPIEQWIGTLSFYAICLLSFMAIFLPSFYMTLGGINPVIWAYQFLNLNPTRVCNKHRLYTETEGYVLGISARDMYRVYTEGYV